jgi:hypothetical protein
MMDKPNIVLVHGAFADGSLWRQIIRRLYQAGHRVMAAQNPLTSLADDIANTRKLAEWMVGSVALSAQSVSPLITIAKAVQRDRRPAVAGSGGVRF